MQRTDDSASALIDRALVALATRPDSDRLRAQLADAFVDHHADLWPHGDPNATPTWIAAHVDELLATIERLFQHTNCGPVAHEFIDRMAWLPPLLRDVVDRQPDVLEVARLKPFPKIQDQFGLAEEPLGESAS